MDEWLHQRLLDCLGFPVPDEMIQFVQTLRESHEIDDYFGTLLDFNVPEHCVFLNDFKQRILKKSSPPSENKAPKRNPLATKNQVTKKAENFKVDKPKSNSDTKSDKLTSQGQGQGAVRKKTKYVNLYSNDGQMRDTTILLKGRHLCNCQASKHKLINNCLKCGRIVCEQEGSGPCLFCGNLVCSEEELRIIEQSGKKGDGLKKTLMQQQRPKGWEEALALRNKLLEYDQTSEKRTTVIDDECDYFKSNSVWLSDSERKKLKELEEKMEAKKHESRLSKKITIDFSGRQVIEEPQMTADFQDEILREIAESCSINASIKQNITRNKDGVSLDEVHPLLEYPAPIFDKSVVSQHLSNPDRPTYDGIYNRVQDKELLEISDLRSCLSMHQPWASLLVAGIKKHEGRPWYTSHRGRLWIASTAKPVDAEDVRQMEQFYRAYYNDDSIEFPMQYPSGCLLGCVLVQDCLPQEEYRKVHPTGESESPFVFICAEPQELPIRFPVKGMHKIYKLDQNIHTAAVKSLQRVAKILASGD
ncbi:Activating signal cointegrator 1 [Pseudolycoriella hygida]|uniref:Activating signal cointegrator 1 n=1 Tax=Pseudolycoriella hygida TaxID=35572 RepID=A0A9Q0MJW2_9DIPT|nr:Activating signal cointegrator 1 [Pseudolycoriella hygida]